MSIGGLLGAVAGGVIGFFIGCGPMGAFYGASIGFALGMVIDPITPDVAAVGTPLPEEVIMSGEIGVPIPDLAGSAKIMGHLLCFGKERSEAQYTEIEGGKGSDPEPVLTGYKYYMSWAVGILAGPAGPLCAIYKNEDIIWEGELDCPASGGQETITLEGMGSATFYFGTDDQVANSKVGEIIGDATLNSPYRNLCWCFFDDCYIGEYPRAPSIKFVLKKIPEYAFSDKHEIQTYDCNPAHVEWFILHDLLGLSEDWLHSTDFAAIASTLLSESRGLSVLFDKQQNALNYLESINAHIDGILRYGSDAKFHPKLIRDDYTVEDLPTIDEDVMLDEPTLNRKSWIDTINELKVQYSEITGRLVGFVYGTGQNYYSELGLNDTVQRKVFTLTDAGLCSSLSCGGRHTFAKQNDGSLQATGKNDHGQLGTNDLMDKRVFTKIDANVWKQVVCGQDHTAAIKADGTLWVAGRNSQGQLGLDDLVMRDEFTQVGSDKWVYIACGYFSTYAIKENGTLWSTGGNGQGQLGLNDTTDRKVFTQVGVETSWEKIFSGGDSASAFGIRSDNTLWAVGYNLFGQLGLGDTSNRDEFTQVGTSLWEQVACGGYFSMALKIDGTLWSTGWNYYGQLGLDDFNDRDEFTRVGSDIWKQVACGDVSAIALSTDSYLFGTGRNDKGQLGFDDYVDRKVFEKIGADLWLQVATGSKNALAIQK